jgi:hypothetical protein
MSIENLKAPQGCAKTDGERENSQRRKSSKSDKESAAGREHGGCADSGEWRVGMCGDTGGMASV